MKQVLTAGIIRAPHGVKGLLKVHLLSDDIDYFFNLKEIVVEKMGRTRNLKIESVQRFSNGVLVKFDGINTPEDARLISGWNILIPRNQASKLEKDEVYTADLIGMKLVYDKEEVGTVVSVSEGPQSHLLEVECADSKTRIVPYYKGVFVEAADLETNTIQLLKKDLIL